MWSPRATVYIADVPWWVWRRGQLSLLGRKLSGTPPPTSAFQRKSDPYVSRFIYTSTRHGGTESRVHSPQDPHPTERMESMCPFQGLGAVTGQPSEPEGQVRTLRAPIGDSASQAPHSLAP